jgi:TIR domain
VPALPQLPPSIFLSHSHADSSFAKTLAKDLSQAGARVWIDEAEIQVGDSLIEKIRDGIDSMDYLAVVLSPESVNSQWVRREVDIATNQEIEGKRVKVLPLLYKPCDLPGFLKGKLYSDFTVPSKYDSALGTVLRRLGLSPAQTTRRYDPHPFPNVTPLYGLSPDARHLLVKGAYDKSNNIVTEWLETGLSPRLRAMKASEWEVVVMDSEQEAQRWQNALKELEERRLIQHVASRPGYKAHKITPSGWALVEATRA